jgi:hypothetical protein
MEVSVRIMHNLIATWSSERGSLPIKLEVNGTINAINVDEAKKLRHSLDLIIRTSEILGTIGCTEGGE